MTLRSKEKKGADSVSKIDTARAAVVVRSVAVRSRCTVLKIAKNRSILAGPSQIPIVG